MNTPDPSCPTSGTSPQSTVVLLVDDQAIVGEAIRRMLLTEQDVDYHFCADPAQALERAIQLKPSVILLDLIMPGSDGFSMLAAYRQHPSTKDVPVIVMSSKDDPGVKRDAFGSGANDYLVKLPDPVELIARVRAHSRGYHAQQELRVLQQKLEASNAVLRQLSTQDGLTGLANRRFFDEEVDREWRRCLRSDKDISLIMIDVDGFKLYNDHYGHQAGDDCLRLVARSIKSTILRPGDTVARYGGEEFAVILPETGLDGAVAVAERLKEAVKEIALSHEKSPCSDHVTVSLGVASIRPKARTSEMQRLIQAADQALYRAKRSGRNRVATAPTFPDAASAEAA